MILRALLLLLTGVIAVAPSVAATVDWRESAQTTLHLLDYVGVDYPEFVKDGEILDEAEYAEQLEFTTQVVGLLKGLPEHPQRAQLIASAEALEKLVKVKGSGAQVAAASGELRWAIIAAYGLVVAPKQAPDLARGQALYAENCVTCHGAQGRGDGPAGEDLDPTPSDFTDVARIEQRSVYGLYNTITLGVAGTGMAAYKEMKEEDRWALALFVAQLSVSDEDLARGEAAWKSGAHAATFPDLANVATLSSKEIESRFGGEAARAQLWLRAHPEVLAGSAASPMRFTVTTLGESSRAYRDGDAAAAQHLAVTAYLEGFELVEASLDRVDAPLRARIERELMGYRALLKGGAPPAEAERQVARIVELLEAAEAKLEREGLSPGAVFVSSLLILLREGLEAILVLAAIIAFLVKSGRRDALPWVHLGWAAAVALGALTWIVATNLVSISGASREMTEAVTALCAAGVLVYVGIWLHSRAHSQAWQTFLREKVGGALSRRTLWALVGVSFLAVYRELFEIVLFYQALWMQAGEAGHGPLLGGIGVAAGLLALAGWATFQYGVHLPINRFFTATSVLLAALAVVFVGQGVAALQEAGAIASDAVAFVRIPALGIFPTAQSLVAQVGVALLLIGSFAWGSRQRMGPQGATDPR